MEQQVERRAGIHGYFQQFVHSEVSGSVVLLTATVTALVWANSPAADTYFGLVKTYLGVSWGTAKLALSLQHWVNDLLMALFFFVVGLEIKREILVGELAGMRRAASAGGGGRGGHARPPRASTPFSTATVRAPRAGAFPWPRTSPSPWAFSLCSAVAFRWH